MAGCPAMVNPSAAELQAVVDRAQVESGEVSVADRAYDDAQKAGAALRGPVDALIAEVMDQLRYTLLKFEPSNQRRIMRSYGAIFTYADGETADPELSTEVEAPAGAEASPPA